VSIPKVSVQQLKAARALVGWSQEALAASSGVSLPTIKRLEATMGAIGGRSSTVTKLIAALSREGIIFIEENGEGPGVRLRKQPDNGAD
jgi:predicted transcriptional regulator